MSVSLFLLHLPGPQAYSPRTDLQSLKFPVTPVSCRENCSSWELSPRNRQLLKLDRCHSGAFIHSSILLTFLPQTRLWGWTLATELTVSREVQENHTGIRQEKHFHSKPNRLAAFCSDSEALIHQLFLSLHNYTLKSDLRAHQLLTPVSVCCFLGMPPSGEGREPILTPSSVFRNGTWAPKSANA